MSVSSLRSVVLCYNTATRTEIYTLSLHDALPIWAGLRAVVGHGQRAARHADAAQGARRPRPRGRPRSEEHTSELQSRQYLVCRLLLEKKKPRHTSATASPPANCHR